MRIIKYLFVLLAALILVGLFVWKGIGRTKEVLPAESEAPPETLSSNEGGVEVVITPTLGEDFWSFEIVFDTHSVELDFDLQETAFLVDEDGIEYRAVSWEGDPPGGHHRKGILRFNPLNPAPATLKLKMRDIGATPERSFEWKRF